MISISVAYIWLIAAVMLMALEAFGLPGIGLMFAGLGALIAGMAIQIGLVAEANYILQGIIFFLGTVVSTALLWKPLQKWRIKLHQKPAYDSLVGGMATVHGAPLGKKREGQVMWSGTIMAAELAPDATVDELPVGTRVTVGDVRGSLVIVRPRH